MKPVTRANYVRHLRAFFRCCKAEHLVTEDITEHVRLERLPRQFPKALRPEGVEQVAAYAETNCRDGEERSSAWCPYFIRLGTETAMRRNELLNLRREYVDLDAGHLTVACTDAFTTKSGVEREDHSQGVCSDTVKRFAVKAGVPPLTPHALRHSCITWLIERGVPVPIVQRFAGHADIATTMRYCSIAEDVHAGHVRAALTA